MSQNNSVLFILTFDWLKIILNLYQLTFFKNNAESNSGVKKKYRLHVASFEFF